MQTSATRTMNLPVGNTGRLNLDDYKDCMIKIPQTNNNNSFFIYKPAYQAIKEASLLPPQKQLFGELFYENELCCLFADTNTGKSILAVQIGETIARGNGILLKCEMSPQKVAYFDFELTAKQFQGRYTDSGQLYQFSENLLRIEINTDAEVPNRNFEEYLVAQIEKLIEKEKLAVLIIDNITYLRQDNEKAKDALALMKQLKQLKSKYQLSILCLAHTPKRDGSKPITRNDLAGSKMLINFFDSAFCIGESSKGKTIRYIKQIKCRNSEIMYDTDNVLLCEIVKENCFLQLKVVGYEKESEHLKTVSDSQKNNLDAKIIELKKKEPYLTDAEIANQLNTYKMKVGRVLNNKK